MRSFLDCPDNPIRETSEAVEVASCCYTCYDDRKGPLRPSVLDTLLLTLIAYRMTVVDTASKDDHPQYLRFALLASCGQVPLTQQVCIKLFTAT